MADKIRTLPSQARSSGREYLQVPNSDRYVEVVDTILGNEIIVGGKKVRPVDPLLARSMAVEASVFGGADLLRTVRATGQMMLGNVAGYGIGASNVGMRTRLRHLMQGRAEKMRARFSFYDPRVVSAGNIVDTLMTQAMAIQCGAELAFVNAMTGIPARQPFLFSGANWKLFDPVTWDPNEFTIVTDWLDAAAILGRYLEDDDVFGTHTGVEVPSGQGANVPLQRALSNAKQRWIGVTNSATSIIAGYGGGNDAALTATSYNATTTNTIGAINGFGPAQIEIMAPRTMISVAGWLDSMGQDQKEGYAQGVPAAGDVLGDADGNTAFFMRAMARFPGIGAVNLGRGSDGFKNTRDATKIKGRGQRIAAGGFTCIDCCPGMNDIEVAGSPTAWAADTDYLTKFATRHVNNGVWMVVIPGRSAASGAGPSGTPAQGALLQDGTVTWAYCGPRYGDDRDCAYQLLGQDGLAIANLKQYAPLATIRRWLPLTKTSSTDGWATAANMTVFSGRYRTADVAGATRGTFIRLLQVAALRVLVGIDEIIDVRSAIEDPATNLHLANGTAGYITDDGVHPGSIGQGLLAAAYPAPPAVTPLQLAA